MSERTEFALENDRLLRVFEQAPAFMCILSGPEQVFELANAAYLQLVGQRDLVGKTIREALPELEGQGYYELLERVYRTGEPFVGRKMQVWLSRTPHEASEEVFVDFVYQPLRDQEGAITGVLAHGTEVTEWVKAEKELSLVAAEAERARRLYETALSNTADFNYVFDLDGRFIYVNQALLSLLQIELAYAVGKNFHDLQYPPELATRLQHEIAEVIATRAPLKNQTPYTSASGTGYYEYIFVPVFGADGTVEAVAGSTRDITEQKRTEVALRESEERLRLATEAAELGIWVWHVAEDRVTWENDRPYALFGISREEGPINARRFLNEFVHPDDAARFEEAVAEAVRSQYSFYFAGRFQRRDGELRWCELSGRVQREADGAPLRIVGTAADITDARVAEEHIRQAAVDAGRAAEANAKFRTMFEQGAQFAGILAVDGTVMEANRLSLEACGYSRADVVGKPFWECGWWNRSPELMATVRAASLQAAAGEMFRTETHYFIADGSMRFMDLIIAPVTGDDGRVLFLTSSGTDITDRKLAEEERQKFVSLAENSPDFVAMFDLEGLPLYINRAGLSMVGLSGVEAGRGTPLREFFFPDDQERVVETFLPSVLREGGGELEVRFRHFETAAPCWMCFKVFPLLNAAGQPIGLATVSQDVTARRQFEHDLRRLADDLSEADRRKDEFLATLAHELRNPLAPVRTGLHLLRSPRSGEATGKTLAMMERQLAHMVRLIDDLMDISRVSRGKIQLKREPVVLSTIIETALETSRPLLTAAAHQVTVRLPSETVLLNADAARLSQVVSNLLNNAARYTPEGGRVELTAECHAQQAVIRVRDNGMGIPAEMLPKVFDIFTQVGRATDRAQGGLGIGLSLVKRLVEMHGGTVEAASEGVGRGSTFSVSLPRLMETATDLPAPRGETEPPPSAGSRILVVDDNIDGAETLAMLLEGSGHAVRTAYSGPAALQQARAFQPELVLLDLGLPGMNGFEVARELRADPAYGAPVLVALTGWGSEEDRRRSREAGFSEHLTKPADVKDVRELITRLTRVSG